MLANSHNDAVKNILKLFNDAGYDICNSTLYVINYVCHSAPSECPPFALLCSWQTAPYYIAKGVLLFFSSLKLFETTRLSRGFRDTRKSSPHGLLWRGIVKVRNA